MTRRFREFRLLVTSAIALTIAVVPVAQAAPLTASPPVEASATNPLAGCSPDASGTVFPDSEVEPWVDVNPTDPLNIVGGYQQDRYSNGGAKANVATVSIDGGLTWAQVVPPQLVRCSPGGGAYERATDWHERHPSVDSA